MTCFHPIRGFRRLDGGFTLNRRHKSALSPMAVACGQCWGCRREYARVWATRCLHEASLFKRNCFITLTYDNEHLPEGASLNYRHFQLFMKRLRFHHKGFECVPRVNAEGDVIEDFPIRFYMCGEYGEDRGRPHYHALLFNFDFPDKYEWASRNGNTSFRSEILDGLPRLTTNREFVSSSALWPYGNAEIGEVNFQSASYCARYIMKKIKGNLDDPNVKRLFNDAYEVYDYNSGEIFTRVPEFCKMSRRPGIGSRWISKFQTDVYPHDYLIVNGNKSRPPRYYDTKFECLSRLRPEVMKSIKDKRNSSRKKSLDDNTPARLLVKEKIAEAIMARLPRHLK